MGDVKIHHDALPELLRDCAKEKRTESQYWGSVLSKTRVVHKVKNAWPWPYHTECGRTLEFFSNCIWDYTTCKRCLAKRKIPQNG